MRNYKVFILFTIISVAIVLGIYNNNQAAKLPIIAIANYGPHSSLDAAIRGTKEELARQGFIEGKTVRYQVANVGFDAALVPQMVAKLKNQSPKVMIVMTTPIAQYAKGSIQDLPLIYNVITDPIEAGLIKQADEPEDNMTGSSDQQDLNILLKFASSILPNAKRVGILYSTAESNDLALVKMISGATRAANMQLVAISVDQPRDIPLYMQKFKEQVDFIYVGTSGPIQPALPVIAAEANKMNIPVLNVDEGAVKEGIVLASFGVNYIQVGANAGKLAASLLGGEDIANLKPIYPSQEDHIGFINRRQAAKFGIDLTKLPSNVTIVE